MTQIKYSPLRNQEIHTKPKPSIFSTSKICGFFSCILVAGCVCVSIALAKLTTENKFLQSPYTNYTSSYSFGVVSDFHLDLSLEKCCQFETDYSCICCPNNPTLLNATFHSFVKVLRMYVNTKFIFYLGNIASKPNQTIQTYSYFRLLYYHYLRSLITIHKSSQILTKQAVYDNNYLPIMILLLTKTQHIQ